MFVAWPVEPPERFAHRPVLPGQLPSVHSRRKVSALHRFRSNSDHVLSCQDGAHTISSSQR